MPLSCHPHPEDMQGRAGGHRALWGRLRPGGLVSIQERHPLFTKLRAAGPPDSGTLCPGTTHGRGPDPKAAPPPRPYQGLRRHCVPDTGRDLGLACSCPPKATCGQGHSGSHGAAARGQPWARPWARLPTMHTRELVPARTRSLAPSVQMGEAETDSPMPALHRHSLVPSLDCPLYWDPNSTQPALPPDAGQGAPLERKCHPESRRPDPAGLAAGLKESRSSSRL